MQHDVIVIGGSYAGLAASLQLARARRKVLVIDGADRRNRFASAAHGFLGQDGRSPAAIVADGRAQLMQYPTVEWLEGVAVHAARHGGIFAVDIANGERHEAQRLVLATGVKDELPAIPGLAERWGTHVFHCPYCHGYELQQGRIGVLGVSAMSMHHALMLPDWGPTTFLLNDAFEPDTDQLVQLQRRGVTIERERVAAMAGERADVILVDGRTLSLDGLFTLTRTHLSNPLIEQLGCALENGPLGDFVRADAMRETSVPGVFACGDAARAFGSLSLSVGDGTMAGVGAHASLVMRDA